MNFVSRVPPRKISLWPPSSTPANSDFLNASIDSIFSSIVPLGYEIDVLDALGLTQSVHPPNALFEYRGIPGQVPIDDGCRGVLRQIHGRVGPNGRTRTTVGHAPSHLRVAGRRRNVEPSFSMINWDSGRYAARETRPSDGVADNQREDFRQSRIASETETDL